VQKVISVILPESMPKLRDSVAFYIDKKDEELLVAFDSSLYYPRCRIDFEAYNVVLLCDGNHTIKEIAGKTHQSEQKVLDLMKILCDRHLLEEVF
jgi:hypothetical protein